jgi:protein-S-isoprenylcysteine O-methyltransferase Ste14
MNGTLKGVYFLGILALTVIRSPHERQRRRNRIAVDRVTGPERFVIALLSVGPREEQMMLEQFGDAYRVYMNRTGRLVPGLEG